MGRALSFVVTLTVFVLLASAAYWIRQQQRVVDLVEDQANSLATRAALSERRAVLAEASLTAIADAAVARAGATTTAQARANEPEVALRAALDSLFALYQRPSAAGLKSLQDLFAPEAFATMRPEVDHLLGNGLYLGGQSSYRADVVATTPQGPERVELRTREQWTYEERDGGDRPVRCLREESVQTYGLQRVAGRWVVQQVALEDLQRTPC